MDTKFWIPTRPYNLIGAINRMAAATGSMRYAQLAADADYNGHHVTVSFNDYRGYWIAEYFWAGRNVLARGELSHCLRAAKEEHDRGALGSTVVVTVSTDEDAAEVMAAGFAPYDKESEAAHFAAWKDARFAEINGAMDYERHGLAPAVGFLANSATVEEYEAKLETFFAQRKAAQRPREPRHAT